jgi:SAM-dependent methyltransferase
MPLTRSLLALAAVALLGACQATASVDAAPTPVPAAPASTSAASEACEAVFRPQVGQQGKDVVWVPTPDELVDKMLSNARVTAQDFVVDLGAGDGKIAIAAAKRFGAQAKGIEYNPDMVRLAQCHVQAEGVQDRVTIIQGDIFKEDFSQATVVTMYLLPELNLCVRHRVLAMRPGTRVTSHAFTMGDWDADLQFDAGYRRAFLWTVPAAVGGSWVLRGVDLELDLTLHQSYQKVGGEVTLNGQRRPLLGATLDGKQLRFAFVDAEGRAQHFSGAVDGSTLLGELRSGTGARDLRGTLQGAPAPAPWAQMAEGCARFYR